ncbi:hypothetical protein WN944_023344 [Citrus x changshan-huyou]|uniref:Protein kinase domain-containing protein n=1 Tax=Citrus x changshan-huyou TaxID=2935761 RepID=A0AAP0N313_9ROSI
MICQGNVGCVNKGNLGENRMPVAVKAINLMQEGARKSFVAECETFKCRSLDDWSHQSNDQLEMGYLNLIQRLNLVTDLAFAIEYLHHHCQPPIVHADLTPNNVLLDHDVIAHVGDFGSFFPIARLVQFLKLLQVQLG